MRIPPVLLCVFALSAAGGPLVAGVPREPAFPKIEGLAELRERRNSAKTPAEKVAATGAWLKAHPPATSARIGKIASFEARMAALADRPAAKVSSNERAAQTAEIRRVLNETLSTAKTPRQAIALTDEFIRLNAEALSEMRPRMPSAEERKASLLRFNVEHPAKPGDLRAETSQVLREILAEARTPFEAVVLKEEFMRLNAEAFAEAYPSNRISKPSQITR